MDALTETNELESKGLRITNFVSSLHQNFSIGPVPSYPLNYVSISITPVQEVVREVKRQSIDPHGILGDKSLKKGLLMVRAKSESSPFSLFRRVSIVQSLPEDLSHLGCPHSNCPRTSNSFQCEWQLIWDCSCSHGQ